MASCQDLSTWKVPYREPLTFMGGVPKSISIWQVPKKVMPMGKRLLEVPLMSWGSQGRSMHESGLIPKSACCLRVGESAYLWPPETLIPAFLPGHKHQGQCLAYSMHSVNTFWVNKCMNKYEYARLRKTLSPTLTDFICINTYSCQHPSSPEYSILGETGWKPPTLSSSLPRAWREGGRCVLWPSLCLKGSQGYRPCDLRQSMPKLVSPGSWPVSCEPLQQSGQCDWQLLLGSCASAGCAPSCPCQFLCSHQP